MAGGADPVWEVPRCQLAGPGRLYASYLIPWHYCQCSVTTENVPLNGMKRSRCPLSAAPLLILQSAQIFQIPWKHAARHGWSIDQDATLFRSWAIHTGRKPKAQKVLHAHY